MSPRWTTAATSTHCGGIGHHESTDTFTRVDDEKTQADLSPRLSVDQNAHLRHWLPDARLQADLSWNLTDTVVLEIASSSVASSSKQQARPTLTSAVRSPLIRAPLPLWPTAAAPPA